MACMKLKVIYAEKMFYSKKFNLRHEFKYILAENYLYYISKPKILYNTCRFSIISSFQKLHVMKDFSKIPIGTRNFDLNYQMSFCLGQLEPKKTIVTPF